MALAKNAAIDPSGNDLGLGYGDTLEAQVQATILERRKKGLQMANQPPAAYGVAGLGSGLKSGLGGQGGGGFNPAMLGTGGFNG